MARPHPPIYYLKKAALIIAAQNACSEPHLCKGHRNLKSTWAAIYFATLYHPLVYPPEPKRDLE